MTPINIANSESKGMTLVDSKKDKPTKELSFEKLIGTFTVIIMIKTKSSQRDKK